MVEIFHPTVRTSQSNHRSSDGWLIDRNAALGHHLLEIARAELGGQVPAHDRGLAERIPPS
ncbi:hypothetical protein MPL3356_340150 [Mesorhizobium plurifarium]|uniref:Uncharacterized protein n=1 Tax=Mesorhizobium plurifarium TaxID=69974 RepID=A0A090DVI3_MESPL|nr:hypothetical protein MPL3356_340150 [Mesorhizobium plurifarium]